MQDLSKAFKFFSLAAEQGWVDGQLQLGIMYYSMLSVLFVFIMVVVVTISFRLAVAAVFSNQWSASSPTSWRDCKPPLSCVSGHESTTYIMVWCWPHTQTSDVARPHLHKLARQWPWSVQKQLSKNHEWQDTLDPSCQTVGSVTRTLLTTDAICHSAV